MEHKCCTEILTSGFQAFLIPHRSLLFLLKKNEKCKTIGKLINVCLYDFKIKHLNQLNCCVFRFSIFHLWLELRGFHNHIKIKTNHHNAAVNSDRLMSCLGV